MHQEFQVIGLLAGIGIFLFGIFELEESLKKISGGAFRKLIRKFTGNWFRSVLTGIVATAVLQSSSAVTLIVLAFAGAGLLGMENAIGVVMGSNLGTTLTSWIVALVGFKLKIEMLALPFIGLGGLGLIFFGKSTRATNISRFMVGFGFLFLGLDYMKSSIEGLAYRYDLSAFQDWPGVAFIGLGLVLTALVQSSSAAMAIILSAMHSQVITFPLAAYFVIGTNLGTTATVLIGSLGGQVIKRQVALSHLFFNLGSSIIVVAAMPVYVYFIEKTLHLQSDPVTGLAMFHTLFNLTGILIFLPMIGLFTQFITKIIREEQKTVTYCLHTLKPDVPEAGIAALKTEIRHLIDEVIRYQLRLLKLMRREFFQNYFRPANPQQPNPGDYPLTEHYDFIKSLETEIYTFASSLQMHELRDNEATELNRLLHATRNAVASAKILKDVQHNFQEAEQSDSELMNAFLQHFRNKWASVCESFLTLLNKKNAVEQVSALHVLHAQNKKDDLEFTQRLTSAISAQKISSSDIPTLITMNRAFNLSVRQMIHALRDLLLSENEADIVEKLSEVDQVQ
ncbi:MAG: Na/Pi symporter [Cyclobacteriaceae bacterium]|nr:Na/Pi symporter [Cyclobacteriaceae bacterium]MCX7636486.1 Na/Pi symporter [Cyclobacteriaceae bacterium]MDW8330519.1 Na/Pi symporter [Cyclobacteriaceae bacterium]